MVIVVQLVERQFVALVVAGSIPVGHPICVISSVGRAHAFNRVVTSSNSCMTHHFLRGWRNWQTR